ncbi:MAG: UvrD-helicase domain-containing protein, partial [Candidatus Thorarchaeota archaeon]
MTTERFPKTDFEAVLGDGWVSEGIILYEECYSIPLTPQARIWIRSSVGRKGIADGTGQDSIRTYLQVYQPSYKTGQYDWFPLKSIPDKKVYRTPSWRENLAKRLAELREPGQRLTSKITPCPECGNVMYVAISGSKKNPGRPYASCNERHGGCGKFLWLDGANNGDIGALDVVQSTFESKEPETYGVIEQLLESVESSDDDVPLTPQDQKLKTKLQSLKNQFGIQLNESQETFVRADVNQDIVLLAPPGSGKTKCIEERYSFLVRQGIDPSNILVVTFSKPMADEMGQRIQRTVPEANLDYISTIHAFCYRALTRWYADMPHYGFTVPKTYEMTKILEEIISDFWSEADGDEVPGWSEIEEYISYSKAKGATLDNCYDTFLELFGGRKKLAEKLTQIRTRFDKTMYQKRYVTFTDMIYLMERMLIENVPFRIRLQRRFSHVIVDEGQDTALNALRILITVSMDVGQ